MHGSAGKSDPSKELEMARSYRGYQIIENPEAYANAIQRSIYARATAKRQREWDAAHPQLAEWLTWGDDYNGPAYGPNGFIKHPLGTVPSFAREAREKWGSLTEKATATLQRIFDERTANAAKRAEDRAAEAASAQAWQPGRQTVEGTIISTKLVPGFSPSRWAPAVDVLKILVKRDDGSKIYLSCPRSIEDAHYARKQETNVNAELRGQRVRFTVTVEPKTEEPTFAFGSRPAKGEILEVTA
jgi:hypothetical protein